MKTVYKYVLPIDDRVEIESKRILRIVHVAPTTAAVDAGFKPPVSRQEALLDERIAVWALVDTEADQKLTFYIRGTGHPVEPGLAHQGTAVMPSGLVWHVFAYPGQFAIEL